MMGRKATLDFFCWEYDFSVEGAGSQSGRLPAESSGWFPYFAYYREDEAGRFLYLYQPLCGSTQTLLKDLDWMRTYPRPHLAEVFDRVDLREEWPAAELHTVKTLHGVTLLEALDGLVAALQARDAALRAMSFQGDDPAISA